MERSAVIREKAERLREGGGGGEGRMCTGVCE